MLAPKSFAFLFIGLCTSHGQTTQTIVWGTEPGSGSVITSNGDALSLSSHSIELGSFGGFIPTADNASEWVANWEVFDAVTPETPDGDGFANEGTPDAFFGGVATLDGDGRSSSVDALSTSSFGGEQGYVFIRNSDTPDGEAEWLLYTSGSWIFPGAGFSEELLWFNPDVDEVVFGAVNGGAVVGEGIFTDSSKDFSVRMHSFLTVPEPSALGLLGLGLLGMSYRRKRGA